MSSAVVDRLSEVRPLLERTGGFSVGLVERDADRWDYTVSWPTHRTVLRPLLNAAVDCFAYGLSAGLPTHSAIADLSRRENGRHRIFTSGDCISGREVFWNTSGGGRGSVAFYVPEESFRPEEIFPHCYDAWVVSNFLSAHTASAVRAARERVASEPVVAFLLSRNNGIEWLDIFIKPDKAERMYVLADSLVKHQ